MTIPEEELKKAIEGADKMAKAVHLVCDPEVAEDIAPKLAFLAKHGPELLSLVNDLNLLSVVASAGRELQKDLKVWMHFLARDVGTDRQEKMMESFPRVANLSEAFQKIYTALPDHLKSAEDNQPLDLKVSSEFLKATALEAETSISSGGLAAKIKQEEQKQLLATITMLHDLVSEYDLHQDQWTGIVVTNIDTDHVCKSIEELLVHNEPIDKIIREYIKKDIVDLLQERGWENRPRKLKIELQLDHNVFRFYVSASVWRGTE